MKLVGIVMVMMLLLVAVVPAPVMALHVAHIDDDSHASITVLGQTIDVWNEDGELVVSGHQANYLIKGYIKGYSDGYYGRKFSLPTVTWIEMLKAWFGDEMKALLALRALAYSIGYADGDDHEQPLFPIHDLPDLKPVYPFNRIES